MFHNSQEYQEMLLHAVRNDGLQFCLDALQEECSELIQAISHLRRGRSGTDEVISEMADVMIMMDMVRVGIEGEHGFYDKIKSKCKTIGDKIKFKGVRNNS